MRACLKRTSTRVGRCALPAALMLAAEGCGGASLRGTEVHDIGRGTRVDITSAVTEEIANFGYALNTYTETTTRLYWETSWLIREPFGDESARGVEQVRSRVIIRARRGASDLFLVTLRVENYGAGSGAAGEWYPLVSTEQFQEHVRSLANALQIRIDAGMRTRGPPNS